jgi:acetyl esterase/lipase
MKEVFDSRVKKVARPTIMVMKPEKPNGKAVIIFPGGGYSHLAARKEGSLVGEWLNKQGITAFVVKYRVPRRKGVNAPLQDAQRAIRFVRGNAKQFGINPDMIGVMGFSAGGHLSATCTHQFDVASYSPIDDLDKLSCKPDFCILIYPAYLGGNSKVSKDVGKVKDAGIPIYIAISKNDSFISGIETYTPILRAAKVPYEYHVYADGRHGTGLGGFPWTNTCEEWISAQIKQKTEPKNIPDKK